MSLLRQLTSCVFLWACLFCAANASGEASQWDTPAAELARRIADQLGPSSAHLTLKNGSSIATEELPVIRRLLTDDLKAAGVTLTNGESANSVRVTLSENARGGLWIAEIVEGTQTRVAMVAVDRAPAPAATVPQKLALHLQPIAAASSLSSTAQSPILAAAQINGVLAVLFPARISVFENTPQGWVERSHADAGVGRIASRDPRGIIVALPDGAGFEAFAAGIGCSGQTSGSPGAEPAGWTLRCHASDDPWPIPGSSAKAFYNAGRDFFTGTVSPSPGVDLPAFYTAGMLLNRPAGTALVVESTEGKVLLAEHGEVKPISGTRDWGSDFAVVTSGCGAGAQVIVSSSGEGKADSLRAYEIAAQEAAAASEPIAAGGAVMAMWPATDSKSALAIIRKQAGDGQPWEYEVDRVVETCN